MLIRFIVSNFLSFNSEQEFSMNTGLTRQHKKRVEETKKQSLLKFAALYGANASGKSNFVKAIDFSKVLIINGIEDMNYQEMHYKLNEENINKPTKFEYEVMIDEKYYAFGFNVDLKNKKILNEWLVELFPDDEKLIYERSIKDNYYKHDINFNADKVRAKFEFLLDDVNNIENTLLLTEVNRRKKNPEDFKILEKVFHWFQEKLEVIYPDSVMKGMTKIFKNTDINLVKLLKYFDTGIENFELRQSSLEEISKYIPNNIFNAMKKDISDFKNQIDSNISKDLKFKGLGILRLQDHLYEMDLTKEENDTEIKEILFNHNDNKNISFTYGQESDGTRRLIELLNVIHGEHTGKTFVIDELDRSLHPQMTIKFVETFLKIAKEKQTQLIITTHESNLMDLKILRRDEIWFVERHHKLNESRFYSLEEFKVHNTKKVVKDYLIGRYGAVPVFKDFESYMGD
ncbi:MAG: AAA family ATPase [Bacillota bacterium]